MKKIISTAAAIFCMSVSIASAQNTLRGAYFLDGYTSAYKLNPALHGDRSFIAIPVVGNANVLAESNVGISTFLFPDGNGNLNTFLSEAVSEDQFLSNIKDLNLIGASENITILGFGFNTKSKAYHTFDISLKTDVDVNVPGSLFRFMKCGNDSFNLTDMGVKANSFVEVAYGLSEQLTKKLSIGMRAKALVGLGSAEARFSNASFTSSETKWTVNGEGYLQSAGALYFEGDEDGMANPESFNIDTDNILGSYGAAVDLGFEYKLNRFLTFSAALTDLGAIKWSNRTYAATNGESWEFDGFGEIASDSSLDDQIDQMGEDLADCFAFNMQNATGSGMRFLSPTLMAGVEFTPGKKGKFSTGFLGTYHIDGPYSWTEGRLSTNFAAGKILSCSLSGAASTFGIAGGFAFNFHAPGLNIFVGSDNIIPWTRMSNYYVPVTDLNTNVTVGLNILFGKYNGKLRL